MSLLLPELPLIPYAAPTGRFTTGVWRYRASLPTLPECTLGEGGTALLPSRSAGTGATLYVKVEATNPTGSFKDRGSALVISAALYHRSTKIAIASTGNAGASMAAYAARFGLHLVVVAPKSTDMGKLWQITAHGAEIRMVDGAYGECETEYNRLVASGFFPGGSDNPYRQEGSKTIAFELFDELGPRLKRVIVPVGTGGLIHAIHKGFREIALAHGPGVMPAIDGVELSALRPLSAEPARDAAAATAATGINIAQPLCRAAALGAIAETGGMIHSVDEDEIIAAQLQLATDDGIGAEPTGCVGFAAYRKAVAARRIATDELTVVIVTGHILKRPMLTAERRGGGRQRDG